MPVVGDHVILNDLVSEEGKKLNGLCGTIIHDINEGRYGVRITSLEITKNIKVLPKNIKVIVSPTILHYTKNTPYIPYLGDSILDDESLNAVGRLMMHAEYNPYHHETAKMVYESFTDSLEETLKTQTQIIVDREKNGPYSGGWQAARQNMLILMYFGFKKEQRSEEDRLWLQHWFDMIDEEMGRALGNDGRVP